MQQSVPDARASLTRASPLGSLQAAVLVNGRQNPRSSRATWARREMQAGFAIARPGRRGKPPEKRRSVTVENWAKLMAEQGQEAGGESPSVTGLTLKP